jgi:acetyl esterase/lipase
MAGKKIITVEVSKPTYFTDEDVTYAQADAWFGHVTRDLRMDVVYPQIADRQFPCIIWICGGGWAQVSKSAHLAYLTALARSGFVVASVDYRLAHEAPFPGALVDIKAAIRYLRAHAKRYSINAEKFGVSGESAGGYLAAMVALTTDRKFEAGEYLDYSSAVQAACPWYMPGDILRLMNVNAMRFPFFDGDINSVEYQRFINPLSYVTPQAPPFLLLHGTADTVVPFEQSEIMYEALIKQNVNAQLVGLEGEEHAGPQFFQQPVWDMMADFFMKNLNA